MIDFEDKKEVAFRDRYKVGGKIQIKDFQQLDAIDQNNVTRGNPGKHHYLGQTLTIVEVHYEKGERSYCLVKETTITHIETRHIAYHLEKGICL